MLSKKKRKISEFFASRLGDKNLEEDASNKRNGGKLDDESGGGDGASLVAEKKRKEKVKCPICCKQIGLEVINEHIDQGCADDKKSTSTEFMDLFKRDGGKVPMVSVKNSNESKQTQISWLEAEQEGSPVDVIHDVFPQELADELAQALFRDAKSFWKPSTWTVFENTGGDNRLHASYYFQGKRKSKADESLELRKPPPILCMVAEKMTQLVQEKSFERQHRVKMSTRDKRMADDWRPTFVLGNFYRDGSDGIGFHGDTLTNLGQRPIIAMYSLGATRVFKWFKITDNVKRTYSAHVKHNSALIMWPPMQEQFKHGVPKQANDSIIPHPITGLARISLTFRRYCPHVERIAPNCKCGRIASLNFSTKSRIYYFRCNHQGNGNCDFYKAYEDC